MSSAAQCVEAGRVLWLVSWERGLKSTNELSLDVETTEKKTVVVCWCHGNQVMMVVFNSLVFANEKNPEKKTLCPFHSLFFRDSGHSVNGIVEKRVKIFLVEKIIAVCPESRTWAGRRSRGTTRLQNCLWGCFPRIHFTQTGLNGVVTE